MRLLAAAVLAAVIAGPVAADPKPAVEIRMKSVNDLLGYAEYVGGLVGQAEQAKQFAALAKAFTGPKGLEGIDPTKPLGAYAVVTPNVVDSPVVVMVPIQDEEAFLNLLKGRLSLDPKKGDGGVYALDVPNVPSTIFFLFKNGYAYATVKEVKSLAAANLADPKAFFAAGDKAVAAVAVHIDRVPADVKKTVLGQVELQAAKEKEKKPDGESAAQHKFKGLLIDAATAAVAGLFADGQALTVNLRVDPKTDTLALDVGLTAANGSPLAKSLASVAARKAVAPAAAAGKNPAAAAAANFALPDELAKKFAPVIDDILADAVKNAKPEEQEYLEKLVAAVAPTMKAGVVEMGVAFIGPDGDAKYNLTAAVRTVEGKEIEKLAKLVAPLLPNDKFTAEFDAATVGTSSLHAMTIPNDELKGVFGTDRVWATTADGLFVLGFEPMGNAVKKVAAAAPATSEILRVEVGVAAMMSVTEKQLKPSTLKALVKDVFGDDAPAGADTVKMTATGGDKLTVTFEMKGKAVQLLAAIDAAKKQ